MRRVLPFAAAGLLCLAAADPVLAQQRLFALTPHEIVELDPALSSLGRVIRRTPAPYVPLSEDAGPVAAAGGALLVWSANGHVLVYNTQAGSLEQFTLFSFVGRVLGTSADSFRLVFEGFDWQSAGPQPPRRRLLFADVRDGTVRELDLGVSVLDVAYAPQNDLVFVERSSDASVSYVEVRRAGDGSLLQTLPLASGRTFRLAVNESGTRLFAYREGDGIFAYDVVSGALLARNNSAVTADRLIVDEARQRLLSWNGYPQPSLEAKSLDTLQPIGTAALSPPVTTSGRLDIALDVSQVSATIFALQTGVVYNGPTPGPCQPSRFMAVNVDTGEVRKTVALTPVTGSVDCQVNLVRATEPLPPANLAGSAVGSHVDLKWSPVAATRYEIEAGSAPGLVNIGTFSVTDPHLTVDGVPPGVYYVRVRGVNVVGKSAPSEELRVIVP